MIDRGAIRDLFGRARHDVDEAVLPACQLAVAFAGEVVASATFGDLVAGNDTRFVLFSCTKPLVASAVWQLLAEGSLQLGDQVADTIPEFGTNGKDVVTVEQVLLHTSGFPRAPLGPPAWRRREERLAAFARWRLNWEPGSQSQYHPTSAHWVLAELLARVDGTDHREVVRRRVLDPLGITRLALGVPIADQGDVAPVRPLGEPLPPGSTGDIPFSMAALGMAELTEETIIGVAQPDNLEVGVPGAGAVGTAEELALFYQALLHNPGRLWEPSWLRAGTQQVRNTFPEVTAGGAAANRTIGLVVRGGDDSACARGFGLSTSATTFGHPGAGGQIGWADPASGLSFAYLTNGFDRDIVRQARRRVGLSTRAGSCRL